MADAIQGDTRAQAIDPSYWDNERGGWDAVIISGTRLPGLWTVECRARRLIDLKKSAGFDGASVKDKGYEPGTIVMNGRIQSHADWKLFQQMFDNLHPRKHGGERNPFDIYHPALALLTITQAYVIEVRVRHPDNGVLHVEVELLEYFVFPQPANKKNATKVITHEQQAEANKQFSVGNRWGSLKGGQDPFVRELQTPSESISETQGYVLGNNANGTAAANLWNSLR